MPAEGRFAVVKKMLEDCGYRLIRVRGSHHVFKKAGGGMFVVPVHDGKVKPTYVRKIQKECGGEE